MNIRRRHPDKLVRRLVPSPPTQDLHETEGEGKLPVVIPMRRCAAELPAAGVEQEK